MDRYEIVQLSANEWALVRAGEQIATFTDSTVEGGLTGYDYALIALSGYIRDSLRAAADDGSSEDGLLPEHWMSDQGIAFSERLAGGRDFTMTKWLWRDPQVAVVPLMLMTKTDVGHFGAELAGYATEITKEGNGEETVIHAPDGRFYDSEVGVQARDMLLNGESFGVSVDPGEATQVEEEFTCTEFSEQGECLAGEWSLNFLVYEIIGMTMTAMQGFPRAAIKLAKAMAASANATTGTSMVQRPATTIVRASAEPETIDVPVRPPLSAMMLPEPELGEPFLGSLGDEWLVDQGDGALAVPLTIEPPFVFGHIARWGACHTGDPWGPGVCAGPEPSLSGYAYFHTGHMVCDDGTDVPTGVLTVGPEHAPENTSAWAAADFYASAANGWADVHVVDGQYGAWCAGVLRPNLTEMDVRVLRALSLSGDWRGIGGNLEMIGALAVNGPGLPIKRELLRSSAWKIGTPALRSKRVNGEATVLLAAGMVARCADCQRRRSEASAARSNGALKADPRIDEVLSILRGIDARTRHFEEAAMAAYRADIVGAWGS